MSEIREYLQRSSDDWLARRRGEPLAPRPQTATAWCGVTHCVPVRLLGLWKRFMCRRGWHALDETRVGGGGPGRHYLVCDACWFTVYIDDAMTAAEGGGDEACLAKAIKLANSVNPLMMHRLAPGIVSEPAPAEEET